MTFEEFYNSREYKSDKGTAHRYITSFYNSEFTDIKDEKINLIEIGIFNGHSLRLFGEWFVNGNIVGIDNGMHMESGWHEEVSKIPNTTAIFADAYSIDVVNQFEDESLDYVIDDGPHTIESQILAYKLWFSKIRKGGKLIIEDIGDAEGLSIIFRNMGLVFDIYDTRSISRKHDDVIFVFNK